jgi:hypothetical protein
LPLPLIKVLSILQSWLEKRKGEPAQFKTALQFGTKPTVGLQTQAVRHGLQRIRSHERVAIDFLIPNHGNV